MTRQLRPTKAVVDLEQLRANFLAVRAAVPEQTGILAAVKGDAYGHGASSCALALQDAGCDWFGVALVEEGKALRAAGVELPILCMGGVGPAGAAEAIRHRLTPVVSTLEDALAIDEAAAKRREPYGVHLKVDTGMGRLGVPLPHWERFLDRLASLRWIRVDGLCSHLSESEADDPVHTQEQGRRFLDAVQLARARGLRPAQLHLANSGAILAYPKFHFDLVRPGLLLYGYAPGGPDCAIDVKPVMSVTTQVLVVRDLPKGVGVSYGASFVTERPSRIATLPVGYADGYPRALSDKAQVLVKGHRVPVVGRVCMDLCMIDVTDLPEAVEPGDEVVLLGPQGDDRIDAWEIAQWAQTIAYEVLTGFSDRVPRTVHVANP